MDTEAGSPPPWTLLGERPLLETQFGIRCVQQGFGEAEQQSGLELRGGPSCLQDDGPKEAQDCDRESADCGVLEILDACATHVLTYCGKFNNRIKKPTSIRVG